LAAAELLDPHGGWLLAEDEVLDEARALSEARCRNKAVRELAEEVTRDGIDASEFYNAMNDLRFFEDLPGYGYCPKQAGLLCAIQQRFAELYARTFRKRTTYP